MAQAVMGAGDSWIVVAVPVVISGSNVDLVRAAAGMPTVQTTVLASTPAVAGTTASADAVRAPSLRSMVARWFLTVPEERTRRSAMSMFVPPSATSCSWAVGVDHGGSAGRTALICLLDAERADVEAHSGTARRTARNGLSGDHGGDPPVRRPPDTSNASEAAQTAGAARLQVSDSFVDLGWQFFGPLLGRLIAVELSPADREVVGDYLTAVSEAVG